MCAGTKEDGENAFQDDCGRPLRLNNTLTGVVSWGNECDSKKISLCKLLHLFLIISMGSMKLLSNN